MTSNALLRMSEDPDHPGSLLEGKSRVVLYLDSPPGPDSARRLYELYMGRYGGAITQFRSTAFGDFPEEWTAQARNRFEHQQLPGLRQRLDWGFMFGSERLVDAPVFMFHGSRPASEPGRASIVRCDFAWNFDPDELRLFCGLVLQQVECVCGTAGYVVAQGESDSAADESGLMFAAAMRYWGAEAQDMDVSLDCTLEGFPCVSWLTVVGPNLRAKNPDALDRARAAAYSSFEVSGHVIIQAEERPRLIDRNRREPLGNYPAVAKALLPLQAKNHPSFNDEPWDEDLTRRYLHRFSDPQGL